MKDYIKSSREIMLEFPFIIIKEKRIFKVNFTFCIEFSWDD